MGKEKLQRLLKEGKISQSEFNSRLSQSKSDKGLVAGRGKKERKAILTVRKAIVPMDEQDRMMKGLMSLDGNQALVFAATLMFPKLNMSRVTDSYARPTALVKSITTFDVECTISSPAQSDDGRFAFLIQPFLGNVDQLLHYKILGVDSTAGWPSNMTLTGSYLQDIGGRDLRVDQFFSILTQPDLGLLYLDNGGGVVAGNVSPFGTAPVIDPFPTSYNLDMSYNNAVSPATFSLPVGQYTITIYYTGATGPLTWGSSTANVQELQNNFSAAGTGTGNASLIVTFYNSTDTFAPALVGVGGGTVANLLAVPTRTALAPPPVNGGPVKTIRTVAMSALATYIGPLLTNGGNVAAAYVTGDTVSSNWVALTDTVDVGLFQNWENLSNLPGSYNGPLKDGAYVWWSANSNVDYELQTVSKSLDAQPPVLVVSGQWNPGTPGPARQAVMRLEVVTVYEFTTNSLLFESKSEIGSTAQVERVMNALGQQPHAMPNAAHAGWIRNLTSKMSKFWGANKGWMVPTAIGLMKTLV